MIAELTSVADALGRRLPTELGAIAENLERTPWTEVAASWSRLTPSGSPIELTIADGDSPDTLTWTCEIAGPEVADLERIDRVATRLGLAGQAVPERVLDALRGMQRRCELRFGAWLGGRTVEGHCTRFKLYAELPGGAPLVSLPVPKRVLDVTAHAPAGTLCRMVGVEPLRDRVELYLRLPFVAADQLVPVARAAGQPHAIEALRLALPDGLRRLRGRRLGLSVAAARTGALELSLFVSARTMFPGAPEMLNQFIPGISQVPASLARPTLVTLRVDPTNERVTFATGMALVGFRQASHCRGD